MEEFLWLVGCLLLGVAFGWFLREQAAIRRVNKLFAQMEVAAEEQVEDNQIMGTIEVHHGHYYMFHAETGDFLAQGETKQELSAALKARFPDKVFILDKDEYKELGFKNVAL